ncbi:MAG: isoaspartyl peptidase/L-asparaginase [Fervidicoccaceae archaeon]
MECEPSIIVHGGAGRWSLISSDRLEKARRVLFESAQYGFNRLSMGSSAVEAVVEAISYLEDSGEFNAGRGSVFNADGYIEMDAGVMDGKKFDAGAVAALRGIANPIRVALLVMKKTPHVILSGEGARKFALENGFKEESDLLKRAIISNVSMERAKWRSDTVGAVAIDSNCGTAAGASTGGISGKLPGRIGDTPIPGAGFFANHFAAAASTGIGELITLLGISRAVVEEATLLGSINISGRTLLQYVNSRFKSETFGLIGLDILGNYLAIYNTESMPFALFKKSMKEPIIGGFPRSSI